MPTVFREKIIEEPVAIKSWVKDRMVYIELTDYRIIAFLAKRFKLLKNATDEQLAKVELRLNGYA